MIALFPIFARSFSFSILTSSSWTCSGIRKYRASSCSLWCIASNWSIEWFSASPAFDAVSLWINISDFDLWFPICTTKSRTSRFVGTNSIQKTWTSLVVLTWFGICFVLAIDSNLFWNHRIKSVLRLVTSVLVQLSSSCTVVITPWFGLWSHTALYLPSTQCRIRLSKFSVVFNTRSGQM